MCQKPDREGGHLENSLATDEHGLPQIRTKESTSVYSLSVLICVNLWLIFSAAPPHGRASDPTAASTAPSPQSFQTRLLSLASRRDVIAALAKNRRAFYLP